PGRSSRRNCPRSKQCIQHRCPKKSSHSTRILKSTSISLLASPCLSQGRSTPSRLSTFLLTSTSKLVVLLRLVSPQSSTPILHSFWHAVHNWPSSIPRTKRWTLLGVKTLSYLADGAVKTPLSPLP